MADNPVAQSLNTLAHQLASGNCHNLVRKFKGEAKNYKIWIKEVEKFCRLTNADNDESKKTIAYQTAEGIVSDYIERFQRANNNATWAETERELRAHFGSVTDEVQALSQLKKIRQKSQESVQMFGERLLSLAEDAFSGVDLTQQVVARQLIDYFVDGLSDHRIARHIIRNSPSTFNAAVLAATNEQNMIARIALRGRHEFTQERKEEEMEIGEIKSKISVRCFNCNELGHMAKDCGKKKKNVMKCFHCGKSGHIKRNCWSLKNEKQREKQEN